MSELHGRYKYAGQLLKIPQHTQCRGVASRSSPIGPQVHVGAEVE